MPSWSDILLTSAEVAVAFAGFTGLIGLFISRNRGVVAEGEILRFRTMLDYSLIALLAALFPFFPAALQLPDAAIWRISSIAMLFGLVGYWLIVGRSLYRRSAANRDDEWRLIGVFVGGDVVLAALLIENAAGFLHAPSFFAYLVAVFWQLIGAIIGFGSVVTLAWGAPRE